MSWGRYEMETVVAAVNRLTGAVREQTVEMRKQTEIIADLHTDQDVVSDALELLYHQAPSRRPEIEAELRRRGWWEDHHEEDH